MGKQLVRTQPIIESNATMTDAFSAWTRAIGNLSPIRGSGSPEGVVDAQRDARYIDETGSTGSYEWFKLSANIAGDTTKGWVLL